VRLRKVNCLVLRESKPQCRYNTSLVSSFLSFHIKLGQWPAHRSGQCSSTVFSFKWQDHLIQGHIDTPAIGLRNSACGFRGQYHPRRAGDNACVECLSNSDEGDWRRKEGTRKSCKVPTTPIDRRLSSGLTVPPCSAPDRFRPVIGRPQREPT